MQPLNILGYSMLDPKRNFHLHDLLNHKLFQGVRACESESLCLYRAEASMTGLCPQEVGSITLSRETLGFPVALGDLAILKGPVLLCGADKRPNDAVILFPVDVTGSLWM